MHHLWNSMKRPLSLFLVVLMLITTMPGYAFAEEPMLEVLQQESTEQPPVEESPADQKIESQQLLEETAPASVSEELPTESVPEAVQMPQELPQQAEQAPQEEPARQQMQAQEIELPQETLTPEVSEQELALGKITAQGISVSPSYTTLLTTDDHLQATAIVTPETASQQVTWVSSDAAIASVDENGLITPHNAGTVQITAQTTDGTGYTASISVTVKTVTYRLVYVSNYPANAKKFSYANGEGQAQLIDAQNTNAVYEYENEAQATVIGGMTCANYAFLG